MVSGGELDNQHNQQGQLVEALEFEVPGKKAPQTINQNNKKAPHRKWWHSQFNLMILVFALLIATAVLLIVFSPTPNIELSSSSKPSEPKLKTAELAAPWSEQQKAEARTKSQNILAELLKNKASLEAMGVATWAPEKFNHALELAQQGDDSYKHQNYAAAIEKYQSALDKTKQLLDLLPALVTEKLQQAKTELNQGKSELAQRLFNQAIKLEPSNAEATRGLSRAKNLDQVLALLADAQLLSEQYQSSQKFSDLQQAKSKLDQAQKIDPEFQPVTTELLALNNKITDVQFKKAMSKAYAALFANRYQTARREFANALKIKPADPQALAATQQATASDKSSSLASLLKSAQRFEANEEWASALVNYQEVLRRDSNQITAKLGEIKSSARNKLDQQITEVLQDPLAVARPSAKQQATNLLSDAKAIKQRGAKLTNQIQQLSQLLQQSAVKINLRLISDGATNVVIKRDGAKPISLGKFKQQNIALLMGRYVITGQRKGFRDERKQLELSAQSQATQSLVIKCQFAVGVK